MMSAAYKLEDYTAPLATRRFELIQIGEPGFFLETCIYGAPHPKLRPLLIIHPLEFPIPPSVAFCEHLYQSGHQVIFARRPGFGASSPLHRSLYEEDLIRSGTTVATEAIMFKRLTEALELNNFSVMSLGSANPTGYRLAALSAHVTHCLLINPMFNDIIWAAFRPAWFHRMMAQLIKSRSGLWLADQGLKLLIKRDPTAFYRQFYQSSVADLDYLYQNEQDFIAARDPMVDVASHIIYADTILNLSQDPILKDGRLGDLNATCVAGTDSHADWKAGMAREAHRLGAEFTLASSGDLCCAYANPDFILSLLQPARVSAPVHTTS